MERGAWIKVGKYFGTDGVRGKANEFLTPELVYRLGRAGAQIIAEKHAQPTMLIGRDTRVSGESLENALVAGILATGANVIKLGVVPTPAVAYLVKNTDAAAGVMISASHNPYYDNGIKFFDERGMKLADEVEAAIEALLDAGDVATVAGDAAGTVETDLVDEINVATASADRVIDSDGLIQRYTDFLESSVESRLDGLRVVMDTANGAAYELAPRVFRDLGAEVIVINNEPNGFNINERCGSTHLEGLIDKVLAEKADLGFAYDGDADRLLAVAGSGEVIDGDQLLYICGKDLARHGKLNKQTIVCTVMSNLGFHRSLEEIGIATSQTRVGDRYVLEEMVANGYNLGGEQSGHLIFLDCNTTGDGILSSLKLAEVVVLRGESLETLAGEMRKYPQLLENLRINDRAKFYNNNEIDAAIVEANKHLGPDGRVLVRLSGTEPLLRVMVEGVDREQIELVLKELIEKIKAAL
jgi:phosphoglucosamine mutase